MRHTTHGHEKALKKEQLSIPVTYNQKKKNMIKIFRRPRTTSHDDYHIVNRNEQLITLWIRTGHSRL